ncbi:RNA polymerase subunit sigma-70 [Chitinimonas sp. BJB300]|nr:RNA polymerase subunit sigma-70 [Chitinimonas sp. BJB300]TSJ87140.1 sigma-70 family RNA polymerase sigma factor [Chitinimonas sp. BJB300]
MDTLESLNDEALMALIALGEVAEPGRELVLRHQRALFNRLAYLTQGDRDTAADLTQRVWEKVLTNAGSFVGRAAFKTYLHTIARNTFIDWLRVERSRQQISLNQNWDDETAPESMELADEGPLPDALLRANQDAEQVRAALYQLSPIYREALILRYMEDMSVEEVAELTGQKLETTRTRLRYAKAQLRTLLESSHDPA